MLWSIGHYLTEKLQVFRERNIGYVYLRDILKKIKKTCQSEIKLDKGLFTSNSIKHYNTDIVAPGPLTGFVLAVHM